MTEIHDNSAAYCVIGAGPAGLTAAKHLLQAGIPCHIFEREDDVGGNWYYGKSSSSVYKSTHLLSSAPLTAYRDFPMPADYPDYPHHEQVLAYVRDYARHFGLYEHIRFNTAVEHCERDEAGLWLVRLSDGETHRYGGLVICNGHHWDPNYPQVPGHFDGETLHTKYYKTPDVLHGKRVLVVGAGNSGCDLVVEAVHHAEKVFHSTRRGYHYIPKYVLGRPVDQLDRLSRRLGTPPFLRHIINTLLIRIVLGSPTSYGLPKPDHKLLETHPIANSQVLYHVGHGDIIPKPDLRELAGRSVHFVDGSEEEIDLIIYATGYKISFPFIGQEHLNWQDVGPGLYLHAFHPQYDNLFVIGLLQPNSGIFWLMDDQAQLMARFVHAQRHDPAAAARFRQAKAGPQPDIRGGTRHINSPRHFLEVDHGAYTGALRRLLRQLPAPQMA